MWYHFFIGGRERKCLLFFWRGSLVYKLKFSHFPKKKKKHLYPTNEICLEPERWSVPLREKTKIKVLLVHGSFSKNNHVTHKQCHSDQEHDKFSFHLPPAEHRNCQGSLYTKAPPTYQSEAPTQTTRDRHPAPLQRDFITNTLLFDTRHLFFKV